MRSPLLLSAIARGLKGSAKLSYNRDYSQTVKRVNSICPTSLALTSLCAHTCSRHSLFLSCPPVSACLLRVAQTVQLPWLPSSPVGRISNPSVPPRKRTDWKSVL